MERGPIGRRPLLPWKKEAELISLKEPRASKSQKPNSKQAPMFQIGISKEQVLNFEIGIWDLEIKELIDGH
jgi:hypothetical protein